MTTATLTFPELPVKQRFVLEWREDRHGSTGWILSGMDDFDVGQGLTVAHDVLEHFEHKDGDATSEYSAFGCMLWGRVCGDYWYAFNTEWSRYGRPSTPIDTLGQELAEFHRQLGVYAAPVQCYQPLDEEVEEHVGKMREMFVKQLCAEYRAGEEINGLDPDCTEQEALEVISSAAADVLAWVRYGYLRAVHVWGTCPESQYGSSREFQFSNMFHTLETLINQTYRNGEVGDALVINIDREGMSGTIGRAILFDDGRPDLETDLGKEIYEESLNEF